MLRANSSSATIGMERKYSRWHRRYRYRTSRRPESQYLKGLLSQKQKPLIVRIDPLQSNERMVAQQGFFLWKLFEETPYFDQTLMSMMIHPRMPTRPVIRKLEVGERLRIEFLENLRAKYIHRASLFPGLDGFCQSLKIGLEIKVAREAAHASELDRAISPHG
jgi:hypothetical protein